MTRAEVEVPAGAAFIGLIGKAVVTDPQGTGFSAPKGRLGHVAGDPGPGAGARCAVADGDVRGEWRWRS